MEKFWIKWPELISYLDVTKKKIVLFGRSEDWLPKAIKKLGNREILICDSKKSYNNTFFYGKKVIHKSLLLNDPKKYFFIISTGSYKSVIKELNSKKLTPGKDYVCLPEFYDFAFLDNLRKKKGKIILSSSDQMEKKANRFSAKGGGIFELIFDENTSYLKKKFNGSFRQVCKINKKLYAAAEYSGKIIIFDNNYKIIDKIDTKIQNMCGLDYDHKNNFFIATSQTQDHFYLICRKKKKILKDFKFSNKAKDNKSEHHLNDILFYEKQVFFTFFSSTGHWKSGLFNGGLGVLDLNTGDVEIISDNSIQPHSPKVIHGSISYCDSSNAKVIMGGQQKDLYFNGFIRGLTEFNNYVFVGQSETMYLTKMQRLEKTINITSGIYIVDTNSNCKRFITTQGLCNIHDLTVKELN